MTVGEVLKVTIVRCSGDSEWFEVTWEGLHMLLGAESFDFVNLRDGRLMVVDDLGYQKGKPDNPVATAMYHAVCVPGTTHRIVGDVAVIREESD